MGTLMINNLMQVLTTFAQICATTLIEIMPKSIKGFTKQNYFPPAIHNMTEASAPNTVFHYFLMWIERSPCSSDY